MGLRWRTVSVDFRMNRPRDCGNSPFAENYRTGKLDGKACVLRYFHLFIYYLFRIRLFIYFLFIYCKGAVYWVMHQLMRDYFYKVVWRF